MPSPSSFTHPPIPLKRQNPLKKSYIYFLVKEFLQAIINAIAKEGPLIHKPPQITIKLPMNPLEEDEEILQKIESVEANETNQYEIKPRNYTTWEFAERSVSPILTLPLTMFSPERSLDTMDMNLRIYFTKIIGNNLTITLCQEAPRIVLGGIQNMLTGLYGTGILPATTPLNLPYLYQQTKSEEYLLTHYPKILQNLGQAAYHGILQAADEGLQDPFCLPEFPLPTLDITDPQFKPDLIELGTVFTNLKRKRQRCNFMKPTEIATQVLCAKPSHEHHFEKPNIVQPGTHLRKRQKLSNMMAENKANHKHDNEN